MSGLSRRRTFINTIAGWRTSLLFLLFLLSGIAVSGCANQIQGWAGPVVSGNTVYIVTPGEKLLALNVEARSRGEGFPASNEWQFPADKDAKLGPAYATPVLSSGTLYVASYNGKVHALDSVTGQRLWEFPPGGVVGNIVEGPTVAGDTVYLGSSDYYVYALNARNGEVKWRFRTANKVWAGIAWDGSGTVFAASLDHSVYALNARNGELKWKFTTGGAIASLPLYAGGVLYFGSADGKLYAVDAATGKKRWAFNAESWLWGSPLLDSGTLYVGSLANQVYALDAATGHMKWAQPVGGPVSGTPVLVAGVLAVGDQNGTVYGLDPASGPQKWVYTTNPQGPVYTSLASDEKTLYVKPLGQKLIAIDVSTGKSKWVFPLNGWPGG